LTTVENTCSESRLSGYSKAEAFAYLSNSICYSAFRDRRGNFPVTFAPCERTVLQGAQSLFRTASGSIDFSKKMRRRNRGGIMGLFRGAGQLLWRGRSG
jgi:hypothetical protein